MKKIISILMSVAFLLSFAILLTGCGKEYNITVDSEIANGIIEVSKAKAKEGEEIQVTATPNSGYFLNIASLRMNGQIIMDFKFAMPKEDVFITAEFLMPIATNIDISQNLQNFVQTLKEDYYNKENTLEGERQVIEVDETLESVLYSTIYPVTENEEFTVSIFDEAITNQTEIIYLGNNRFIETPLYKKDGSVFNILGSALSRYAVNGVVEISINSSKFKLYLDNELYNTLSISQILQNDEEVSLENSNISFSEDTSLLISLNLFEEPLQGNFEAYSNLTLHFSDESSVNVTVLGVITDGVFELNLSANIISQGKTLTSIQASTHLLELGFLEYSLNIV